MDIVDLDVFDVEENAVINVYIDCYRTNVESSLWTINHLLLLQLPLTLTLFTDLKHNTKWTLATLSLRTSIHQHNPTRAHHQKANSSPFQVILVQQSLSSTLLLMQLLKSMCKSNPSIVLSSDDILSSTLTYLTSQGNQIFVFADSFQCSSLLKNSCTKFEPFPSQSELLKSHSLIQHGTSENHSNDSLFDEKEMRMYDEFELFRLIERGIRLIHGRNGVDYHGFVQLSGIGSILRSIKPEFDIKDYGFNTLLQAVSVKGKFDVLHCADGQYFVRIPRHSKRMKRSNGKVIHNELNIKLKEAMNLIETRYNGNTSRWFDLSLLSEQLIRLCDGKRPYKEKFSEVVRKSGLFEYKRYESTSKIRYIGENRIRRTDSTVKNRESEAENAVVERNGKVELAVDEDEYWKMNDRDYTDEAHVYVLSDPDWSPRQQSVGESNDHSVFESFDEQEFDCTANLYTESNSNPMESTHNPCEWNIS